MPSKKTSPKQTSGQADEAGSFESALEDLQRIVSELESGELQLTESLERYETGIRRLKQCHAFLESAEQRIEQLVGFDAEGNPVLERIDSGDTEDLAEKQKNRQRRRSAASASGEEACGGKTTNSRGGRSAARESMDDPPELF